MGRYLNLTGAKTAKVTLVYGATNAQPNDVLVCQNGGFTITLPATPTERDTIQIIDATGVFQSSNVIVARNGEKIQNLAENMSLDMNYASVILEYSGADYGWLIIR